MPIVTVLEKLYGSGKPETFEKHYINLIRGLHVQLRFVGKTNRGWIQVDVSGKDETVALNLLKRDIGFAPASLNDLKKSPVLRGKVVLSKQSKTELHVDFGVSTNCDATISENRLRAQLADGKNLAFQQLVELFCLYDNMPLEVKIVETAGDVNQNIEASLSEAQLSLFAKWVRCRFDRLIVLGSLLPNVEQAVKSSKTSRDIIKTESLGTLEHVVVCKLGTDAVGLIPRIGRYLKSAVLVPFSPKKILCAVGNEPFDMRT